VNNADLIESSELLLDQYVTDAHKKGLDYWSILKMMKSIMRGNNGNSNDAQNR